MGKEDLCLRQCAGCQCLPQAGCGGELRALYFAQGLPQGPFRVRVRAAVWVPGRESVGGLLPDGSRLNPLLFGRTDAGLPGQLSVGFPLIGGARVLPQSYRWLHVARM